MKKIQKLLVLILAINAIVCGQSQSGKSENQDSISAEWKLLIDDKFEIKYPSDWDVDKNGQMGTSFFLFSPLSDESDKFKENVNLLIQDLTGHNLTLDQFVELSNNQIKTMVTDGQIILSDRITDDEIEYQKIIYSGKQGIFDLKFEQFYWVLDDKAYVLTLTCENSQFNKYQKIGEEILNSFVIK